MPVSSELLKGFMKFYAAFSWKEVVALGPGPKAMRRQLEGRPCPAVEAPKKKRLGTGFQGGKQVVSSIFIMFHHVSCHFHPFSHCATRKRARSWMPGPL